jgi:glutamine synthetase
VYSGLDGIERGLVPPAAADTPYEAKAEWLPRSLGEARAALRADECLRRGFGEQVVDCGCRSRKRSSRASRSR